MLRELLPFLCLKRKGLSTLSVMIFIALGGLNLQLIIRTQKLLHQWICLHTNDDESCHSFTFSAETWRQKSEEEKQEFQRDGIWYDIKEIVTKDNIILVIAKADKWENLFKKLITEQSSDRDAKKDISSPLSKWKYISSDFSLDVCVQWPIYISHSIKNQKLQLLSNYLFFLFRPPMMR